MKKFNLKKKRKAKGMTLLEIIIAIAIVGAMTAALVAASNSINVYLRSANDMNGRVAMQAPIAEAHNAKAARQEVSGGVNIVLNPSVPNGGNINLSGKTYAVFDQPLLDQYDEEFGRGLNMKFIVDVQTTTEATTT
ncbi:MAG: prepilin-type N-terminal cleavage/methylation domain-containing protein [Ruminococcus sp.]|nr:prepilin-type N-terminal cleavage/methylation domain-containing protein [Ruminococcus sp.]